MINLNRYVDCGNGIIEHTMLHHNNMGSDKNLMRLDAPFGSVRFSTLRDVVVTGTNSEVLLEPHELGRYDTVPTRVEAKDTMGYAVFAEDLPSPLSGPYPLKEGVNFKIHDVGCRTAPDYVSVSELSPLGALNELFSGFSMLTLWFRSSIGIQGSHV